MPNLNVITLIGNVTRDPEVRVPKNDLLIATFGLAVNRKYGEHEEVMFIDITSFNKTGELVEKYVRKGDPVAVNGYLRLEQWDAEDGSKRSRHVVICENIQFLKPKERTDRPPADYESRPPTGYQHNRPTGTGTRREEAPPQRPQRPARPLPPSEPDDDDIPF